MRLRLYEVGEGRGLVHRLEGFPVTLSTTTEGELCINPPEPGPLRCVLSEDRGNILIQNRDDRGEVLLNNLPIEQGGLMPGDSLTLGDRAFLVSYERVTAEPPPACRFRL
ncbi:MAG: hypothetical protein AB7U20_08730, partial [Planctomycetaceae bacterium]